jgi:beta-phosphoglucomutase
MLAGRRLLDQIPTFLPADTGGHLLLRMLGKMAAYPIDEYLLDIGMTPNYRRGRPPGRDPCDVNMKDWVNQAGSSAHGLRGVIFDMDGVLVDSHTAHCNAWRSFLDSLGREALPSDMAFILDGRKRIDILRHLFGDLPENDLEEFGKSKDSIFRQIEVTVSAVPGAVRLVRELHQRGVALAVATSASQGRARSTLSRLGLLGFFDAVVTGDDVLRGKPDPAIYSLARERLQLEAKYILAVEDAVSGVQAAVAADLRCIGIALHESPEKLMAAGALLVVREFNALNWEDMKNMLQRRNADDGQIAATGSINS